MIWIGTSGYNYPEWKGSFYPKDLAAAKMLPYYAERFNTVEINYTFYRMPSEKLSTPVRITADCAYFRLRDEGYTPDDIARWAETIPRETASCREVYVYFKHEDEGKGPEFAAMLRERLVT